MLINTSDGGAMDVQMAPEGKVKTAILCGVLGAIVGLGSYLISRKTTEATLDAVGVLMSDMYDLKLKEE